MVIFPVDCLIFHITKTDFLQFLRPERMICGDCDPWLMDGKDVMHHRRVWGFFPPYSLTGLQTGTTAGSKHWYQTKQFHNMFTRGINCIVLKGIPSGGQPTTRPRDEVTRGTGSRADDWMMGWQKAVSHRAHPGAQSI